MQYAFYVASRHRVAQLLTVAGLAAVCSVAGAQATGEVQTIPNATLLRLRPDGSLIGQVLSHDHKLDLQPVQVRLTFAQGPKCIASAFSDAEGMFLIPKLQPGPYALLATGPAGFGAIEVRILAHDAVEGEAGMQRAPIGTEMPLSFGSVPASSYALFLSLVKNDMKASWEEVPRPDGAGELSPQPAGREPQSPLGTLAPAPAPSSPTVRPSPGVTEIAPRATTIARRAEYDITQVRLRIDGNLMGRVMGLGGSDQWGAVGTCVSFFQNGQFMAAAWTDERGYVQVVGLKPGLYSVIAVSQRAFSVFGVRVFPFEEPVEARAFPFDASEERPQPRVPSVNAGAAVLNMLGFAPAAPGEFGAFRAAVEGIGGAMGAVAHAGGAADKAPDVGGPAATVAGVGPPPIGSASVEGKNQGSDLVDPSRLCQPPPPVYLLGPGDVLGIYIELVLGKADEPPPVHFSQDPVEPPAMGYPVAVREDGNLSLPLVPPLSVAGLTVAQTEYELRKAYMIDRRILPPERSRMMVCLLKRRSYRVVVIREDLSPTPETRPEHKTSAAAPMLVIDLRAYENDLLHALAASGGFPGRDAKAVATIFRATSRSPDIFPSDPVAGGSEQASPQAGTAPQALQIPLRIGPQGRNARVSPEEVILGSGDVVVVK